jgi:hypothetical protein
MKAKKTSSRTRRTDVPYDRENKKEVEAFWTSARVIKHTGIAELRAKLAKRRRSGS